MDPPEPEETKLTAVPDEPSTPEICDRPTAIASSRASSASTRRKTRLAVSLPGHSGKAGSLSNWNVKLDVALTGRPVMHFYSGPPMHLLSGIDRMVQITSFCP